MATVSRRESVLNKILSLPLSQQDKIWIGEHLLYNQQDDYDGVYDNVGTPPPSTREEAVKLIEEIDREDEMFGEIPIEDLLEETRQKIKNYGH